MAIGLGAAAGRLPTVKERPLAAAIMSRIDGKTKGHITCLLHAPENFFAPIQTAAHIELEDFRMVRARGDFLQARLGDRADKVHRAELSRRLLHRDSRSEER